MHGITGGVPCYACEGSPPCGVDMVDLLTQERLGEARAVWGLVVETLLCGASPGMDEGWVAPELPDLYSVPCRAVLVDDLPLR